MKIKEINADKLSPAMRQYYDIKTANEDVIIFFRLGDFYEMFFEDAINVSRDLELTLTSKSAGLEERIPMCGVPFHAANIYIERLVEKGYKVGICEQMENPKDVKGIVKRELIQIISVGTKINHDTIDEKENNYIGALLHLNDAYYLAFSDITFGEIIAIALSDALK